MAYGIFLTVLTAIIVTFLGVGIADSEWLKKEFITDLYGTLLG